MENKTVTLADLMNPRFPSETSVLTDANGIFEVERTEKGCCLYINSDENCTPFIMSAIAKYAETHADFDANLVKFGENEEAEEDEYDDVFNDALDDETDEDKFDEEFETIDRFDVDENFTVINTGSGNTMLWNKAENKAFVFSINVGYDEEQEQEIYKDVMEMKYCKRIGSCVYAYSLDDEQFGEKIGLVDVQTYAAIAPQFTKLIKSCLSLIDLESQFLGLTVDERGQVLISAIDLTNGLNIVSSAYSKIKYNPEKEEYSYYHDENYIYKLDEEQTIDITSPDIDDDFFEDPHYDSSKIYFRIIKPDSDSVWNRCQEDTWIGWMIVDCSKLFRGEEYFDIYFAEDKLFDMTNCLQLRYTRGSVPRYSIGDMVFEYAEPINYESSFYIVAKNGKYAFLQWNKLRTGYDFTSVPSCIHNNLYLVEIYGKLGLLGRYHNCVSAVLPIEFSSIKYYDEIEYSHNDNDGQSDSINLKEAFVVNKLGMCAIFTTDSRELIKQVTPFCRKDELKFREIKEE